MSRIMIFLIAFSSPFSLFAYQIKVKGFIAADVLNMNQVRVAEGKAERALRAGIERLDLKLESRFDRLKLKIKLDLDNSSLDQQYNLFEEATLAYQLSDRFKIKLGKGVVPFHLKHWGVLKRSYRDKGTELDPEHSWRDQDKKILLSFVYGSEKSGWINSFTLWGNSSRPVKFVGEEKSRKLSYDSHISFDLGDEQGIANKLELVSGGGNHALSFAGIAYNSEWNPHWSYALDTAYRYRADKREIWFEYTYGLYSTHWGAKNAAYKNREHLVQVGMEQYLTPRFNWLANTEYAKVELQNHSPDLGNASNNDGLLHDIGTFKLETGLKYKLPGERKGHLILGMLYEQKDKVSGGISKPKRSAFQLANTLAYWF